jgi:hypothetical protein
MVRNMEPSPDAKTRPMTATDPGLKNEIREDKMEIQLRFAETKEFMECVYSGNLCSIYDLTFIFSSDRLNYLCWQVLYFLY